MNQIRTGAKINLLADLVFNKLAGRRNKYVPRGTLNGQRKFLLDSEPCLFTD